MKYLAALIREVGPGPALRRVAQKLRHGGVFRSSADDPVARYGFVLPRPFGDEPIPADGNRGINWIIPEFFAGSGGHTTIFRIVRHLEQHGFDCRLILEEPSRLPDGDVAKRLLEKSFPGLRANVAIGRAGMQPAWATVATGWSSAYMARDFRATRHKCYLVQDFEPGFYPRGTRGALAEATYRFGFYGITAGDWLAQLLQRDYGMQTTAFGFGVDHDLYRPPAEPRPTGPPSVFCYARPATERRGFALALMALAQAKQRLPALRIVFGGGSLKGLRVPFEHTSLGTIPPRQLAAAFRDSDAALILSLTNGSLMPLEAMACGAPVVSNGGPHVEWLLGNDDIALLTPPAPEDLADGLVRLLTDADLHRRLSRAGIERAAAARWPAELDKVLRFFETLP
jgi:glycosyltransferase involved in cell wall biosynthesis